MNIESELSSTLLTSEILINVYAALMVVCVLSVVFVFSKKLMQLGDEKE